MTQTKEITGFITGITNNPDVQILTFQETSTQNVIALSLPTQRIREVFPAGEPPLGVELVAVLDESLDGVKLMSMYNPEGDFLDVDELGTLSALDADEQSQDKLDFYEQLRLEREKLLDEIDVTEEDLTQLASEHEAQKQIKPESINYGDPVTGEGGTND